MRSIGTLKQGDTFKFYATLTSAGEPLTGATESLKSQVRGNDDYLMAELTITETATSGQYELKYTGSTQNWSEGTCLIDIQRTDSGVVVSSETFSLTVVRDVTHE